MVLPPDEPLVVAGWVSKAAQLTRNSLVTIPDCVRATTGSESSKYSYHESLSENRMIRALLVAAIFLTPTLITAETSCSANLAVQPSHASSNRHQIVLEAYINDAGPYDFLLDTGSQVTMIDESLASELNIETTTAAAVVGVSLEGKRGKYALVNSVRVGEHANVESLYVLAFDMKEIRAAGYALRGLIGGDFLAHFDATIDNTHNRVCFKKVTAPPKLLVDPK